MYSQAVQSTDSCLPSLASPTLRGLRLPSHPCISNSFRRRCSTAQRIHIAETLHATKHFNAAATAWSTNHRTGSTRHVERSCFQSKMIFDLFKNQTDVPHVTRFFRSHAFRGRLSSTGSRIILHWNLVKKSTWVGVIDIYIVGIPMCVVITVSEVLIILGRGIYLCICDFATEL